MPALHLIKNDPDLPNFTVVDRAASTYSSGYWAVTPEKAASLIGGKIYFHAAQREPSFFGGTVIGFRLMPDGEYAGRVEFKFQSEALCKDVRSPAGWTFEKCYVP